MATPISASSTCRRTIRSLCACRSKNLPCRIPASPRAGFDRQPSNFRCNEPPGTQCARRLSLLDQFGGRMRKKRALGNLDYQGPFGNTLLHGAVVSGDLREVEWLLAAGADPGIANRD